MTDLDRQPARAVVDDVNWLLKSFVVRTPGVERAVGVSSDGLLMALSPPLHRAEADKLAAVISGMTSLALSASRLLGKGPMQQVITEFGRGMLLVSAMRDGSCLGVVTEAGADLGLVGYESAMLVQRAGALLTPQLVSELKTHMMR